MRELIGLPAGATGSNNWAVGGERSVTGTPLIAGDPHLPSAMPASSTRSRWSSGTASAAAARSPGIPTVFFGQNNDVCWTFTNVLADCQDLFVERVRDEDDTYLFEDEWLPLEVVEEEIKVRGRPSPCGSRVRSTHHGPLVNEQLGADDRAAARAALDRARRAVGLHRPLRRARAHQRRGAGRDAAAGGDAGRRT